MRLWAAVVAVTLLISVAAAKDKKNDESRKEPLAWGLLSQNEGCVIFKEYRKTSGRFWGVAVTTKTLSVLEVVEMQNCELSQLKWEETQENIDELQRLALKDKIKFVKIPAKFTNEQLERARTMCREPQV